MQQFWKCSIMKITNDDDDDGWQHRWPSPIWLIHRECFHVKIGFDWANRFIKGIAIVITVNGQHRAVSTHCWAAVPQFCCHLHPFLSFSIEEQFDVAEKGCPFATAVKLKLKAGDWDECSTGEQFRAVTGSKVKKVKDEDGAMAEKGGKTERKSAVQLWILSCSTVYFDTKLLLLINDTSRQKAPHEEGSRWKKGREKRRERKEGIERLLLLLSTSLDSFQLLLPRFATIRCTPFVWAFLTLTSLLLMMIVTWYTERREGRERKNSGAA